MSILKCHTTSEPFTQRAARTDTPFRVVPRCCQFHSEKASISWWRPTLAGICVANSAESKSKWQITECCADHILHIASSTRALCLTAADDAWLARRHFVALPRSFGGRVFVLYAKRVAGCWVSLMLRQSKAQLNQRKTNDFCFYWYLCVRDKTGDNFLCVESVVSGILWHISWINQHPSVYNGAAYALEWLGRLYTYFIVVFFSCLIWLLLDELIKINSNLNRLFVIRNHTGCLQ